MSRTRLESLALMAAVAAATVGCQPPPKPMPPPAAPPPPMTLRQQGAASAAEFHGILTRFDGDLVGLPGHTTDEHRAASAAALADLAAALRAVDGPAPSPAFRTAVGVVESSAEVVGVDGVTRARMEAAETESLHAAATAAGEVAQRVLFDDPEMSPLVDNAMAKADAARASQGPLHDDDVTAGYRSLDAALHRVDADLGERFANGAAPMAMPMAAPPPPVAAAPAAMPMATTMPATMP